MLCAWAVLAVGFAHKMPAAAAVEPYNLSAYLLPDGSRPVVCITDTGAEKNSHKGGHTAPSDCEACRISQGVLLPSPPPAAAHVPVRVVPSPVLPMTAEAVVPPPVPPHTGPRAPPSAPLNA